MYFNFIKFINVALWPGYIFVINYIYTYRGFSNDYPQHMFLAININTLWLKKYPIKSDGFEVEISHIDVRATDVMKTI